MSKNRMLMTGKKQSFLLRVLMKKTQDAGIPCEYISMDIDEINNNWAGTDLLALFMDDGDRPSGRFMHFMKDKLTEEGAGLVLIGEKADIQYVCDHIPGDLIYKSFTRPVDNSSYSRTISDLFNKVTSGEYKKSILMVDDDPNYLSLVREWLKDTYKVAMATSGLQAIRWLGKHKADLILLDHEMPVTSGPQVLEMLRSDEETKTIPVIFLTGKSDKESVMEVLSLKPEGYFLKTIEKEELMDKLFEFFMMRKAL